MDPTSRELFPNSTGLHDFYLPGDSRVMGWLREAEAEGEGVNRSDPSFDKADEAMAYVMGDQLLEKAPAYVRQFTVNQTKKAIRSHVSALTDVRPLFGWKTENPAFSDGANILNQYTIIWWINSFADQTLADAIRYSLVAGAGDLLIEHDKGFLGGDTRIRARDWRDTLPIRPTHDRSLQDWEGLTIREVFSPNALLRTFPTRTDAIRPDTGRFSQVYTRFRRISGASGSGPASTLSGLGAKDPNKRGKAALAATPGCTLRRTFLNDDSINTTGKNILMGPPGAAWSYSVEPGAPLYPQKRLIVWTEHCESLPLYDGPSPYWHSSYPITRLQLDPWPWLFAGLGLMHDMRGGQDALNATVNGFLQLLSQTINYGTVWDKNMPEGQVKRFDPRKPNWKVRRPNMFSEGFKAEVPPQLPGWALPFLTLMFQKFDELSGIANLQAWLQLRQAPGADTIEKFMEALTPEVRLEGRQIEMTLRDVATQMKSNVFQFQTSQRRFMLLGDAGKVVEDFDYDPDTMIPAMREGDANYTPEMDHAKPTHERAKFFSKQFAFFVQPNSMLAITSQERKLTYIQLARQGYVDIWTLADVLEVPNMGTPPPIPLPVEEAAVRKLGPGELPPMEVRVPRTITERLIAQQQLGIGQSVSPVGRKASGQAPPQMVQRPDGSSTITES